MKRKLHPNLEEPVVLEHAQKYNTFQNRNVDYVHWLETSGIFPTYQEILFYTQSKQKREDATYSTQIKFDKTLVNELRIKTALFIDKAKQIIENTQ